MIPASKAETEGVKVGDRLGEVNGIPLASAADMPTTEELAGHPVVLGLKRKAAAGGAFAPAPAVKFEAQGDAAPARRASMVDAVENAKKMTKAASFHAPGDVSSHSHTCLDSKVMTRAIV